MDKQIRRQKVRKANTSRRAGTVKANTRVSQVSPLHREPRHAENVFYVQRSDARGAIAKRPNKRVKSKNRESSAMFPGLEDRVSLESRDIVAGRGILPFIYPEHTEISEISEPSVASEASEASQASVEFSAVYFDKTDGTVPWLKEVTLHPELPLQFSREVVEYARYYSPSRSEVNKRELALRRLESLVRGTWPDASLQVYGSYATGFYLPEADIDVSLSSKSLASRRLQSEMYRFRQRLLKSRVGSHVEVVTRARVPIIKYVDFVSSIPIDISFGQGNGAVGVSTVKAWLTEDPALKILVMVVRQFLRIRQLNEVVRGGIGGFATVCMVRAFLRQHPFAKNHASALRNVGALLLDFFDYYGNRFDNTRYAVISTGSGTPELISPPLLNQRIRIVDPNDNQNDVSKASFNYITVKKWFSKAAELLKVECVEWQEAGLQERKEFSFLGPLLGYTYTEKIRSKIDYRDLF